MMSYINETDFVIENKKLVYPEIVTDGLQLYYDAKGKRDTDYHRDTMLDMSGNKNHGNLYNFAYKKNSGYKDGLVFDYIDDKLVRPTLDLKPDDFTFMLNGNIISFSPDGTVKRVQDGEVIEAKGVNLIKNGGFTDGTTGWNAGARATVSNGQLTITNESSSGLATQTFTTSTYDKLYIGADIATITAGLKTANIYIYPTGTTQPSTATILNTSNVLTHKSAIVSFEETNLKIQLGQWMANATVEFKFDNVLVINLTQTFGAGKEPTKEQMDEIIQRFGFIPNAQDLIDRLEYKGNYLGDMENIIDGLYKTDILSGEEIYTDKADDDAVVHVDIDGKSYQHAGSGKNLVNTRGYSPFSTQREHEIISMDGRRVSQFKTYFPVVKMDIRYSFKENTQYTLQFYVKSQADNTITMRFYYTDGTNTARLLQADNDSWKKYTLSSEPGKTVEEIRAQQGTNSTFSYVDLDTFQLEEGSTATTYEPPAPTTDYPIEIHSLNDFDVVSSVGGRNLIYKGLLEDGSFAWNTYAPNGGGNTTTNLNKRLRSYIPIEPSTNYYVSTNIKTTDGKRIEIGCSMIDSTKTYVDGFGRMVETPNDFNGFVFKTGPNAKFARFRFGNANSGNNLSFDNAKFMLVKSSAPMPYSPAIEDITEDTNHPLIDKINLLLDEPLRSVGDVKDRLFRDNDGLWKIERKVGEDLLDSSSSMTNFGYSNYDTDVKTNRSFTPSADHDSRSNRARTTHFVRYGGSVWAESIGVGFSLNAYNQFHISFPNNLLGVLTTNSSSVRNNKIREWLDSEKNKGTPLTIQYSLRTPKIETMSQEIQDKLNNLRSFEESNYVYTVLPNENNYLSENIKPTLHAKFLYNNWYKEDRVINNLMIYNRALTNEEMLQNYKTIKRRWGM